jgi:predicted AlkP superfamily pyrophosphatase or phosphodiesterase
MTITRANAETELIARAGKRMALVSMAVTFAGTNADLNSPLAYALRKLGLTASTTVTDANLSSVTDDQIDELYDRAELRLLQNILGNSDFADQRIGPRSESMSNLTAELEKAIERMETHIKAVYGDGSTVEMGNIGLSFQEDEDDE